MSRLKFAAVALCISIGVAGTAVPSAAAAPAPATTNYYVVQSGDYLYGIANKLGVKLSDLLTTNSMTVSSLIYPGMRLVVPAGGRVPATTTAPSPTSYTVVSGDSLIGISLKLKVSLSSLLTLNRLTTSSLIYPGMKLAVPAGAVTQQSPTASNPAPVTSSGLVYVIKSGDTLIGIASRTKVTLSALLSLNRLTTSSFIYPGMRLNVPAGGVLPASSSPSTPTTLPSGDSSVSTRLAPVIAFARAQLGKPYQFFSAGPNSYDCSGLTMAAYAEIGISLPHYSGAQARLGLAVDWRTAPVKPGDLVVLESYPGSGIVSHIGIAISGNQYIHAASPAEGVKISMIPTSRLIGVRRLVSE